MAPEEKTLKNSKETLTVLEAIADKALEIQKTFEKSNDAAETMTQIITAQETKVESLIKLEKELAEKKKKYEEELKTLDEQIQEDMENNEGQRVQFLQDKRDQAQKNYDDITTKGIPLNSTELEQEREKLQLKRDAERFIQGEIDSTKKLIGEIEGFLNTIPVVGSMIGKALGLSQIGKDIEENLQKRLKNVGEEGEELPSIFSIALSGIGNSFKALGATIAANPVMALLTLAIAVGVAFRNFKKEARDTANELEISAQAAQDMAFELKQAEFSFKFLGLDSAKLKTTLTQLSEEFGTMEMITVENAVNIEKMAQEMGVAGIEIVKFNKVMMDLTGASFDVANNIAQSVADLAESEGVAVGRVMKDVATNAETFAKFSMDGAEGLARAAVEAAKIGGSLSEVLKVADDVLKLETSISNQFKAQVITGKQINLETARRLALEGDIEGLTREVQDIVRNVGDLQTMNVIERQSIADALGISVRELQRISRGEAQQERESVQDKLDVTNKLLAQLDEKAAAEYALLEGGIDTNDATVRVFT